MVFHNGLFILEKKKKKNEIRQNWIDKTDNQSLASPA